MHIIIDFTIMIFAYSKNRITIQFFIEIRPKTFDKIYKYIQIGIYLCVHIIMSAYMGEYYIEIDRKK